MPLINCKVDLKLKWKKHCVLAAAGAEDAGANSNNTIFTIKDTKFYVPVITLSAKDNQKLWKLLSKGFERSVYWDEYKTKNKNIYFLESNFVRVDRLFISVYSKAKICYLPKSVIKNYNIIINGKNFYFTN